MVGVRLNSEPQTPFLSYIPNATLLILKLLLSAGRNISKERLRDFIVNEDSSISPTIFHLQLHAEHTLGEKRNVMHNNFFFHGTNIFSLNVGLYIFLEPS